MFQGLFSSVLCRASVICKGVQEHPSWLDHTVTELGALSHALYPFTPSCLFSLIQNSLSIALQSRIAFNEVYDKLLMSFSCSQKLFAKGLTFGSFNLKQFCHHKVSMLLQEQKNGKITGGSARCNDQYLNLQKMVCRGQL